MTDELKQAIQEIKLRLPIEEVVRERVEGLKRAGSLWVACCPFHEERTPSFKVDPRRGTWRCYGACGVGGDQISFVERAYNVEFLEALQILASRAGVALPERRHRRPEDREENEPLVAVLARAQQFYQRQLHSPAGAGALEYVRRRGLHDATLDAFGVGFAPPGGRALTQRALESGVALEHLVAAGLTRHADEGTGRPPRDFFQGRLMFPVRDLGGRTLGFGGRRLDDSDPRAPKYVNTPETAVFKKGRLIYGLDLALEHVRRSGHLVLVEGYTDVMAAHQVGLRDVVAVLGSATTDEHAALVRRTGARRVTLLFDGDAAGRKATYGALDGLVPLDLSIDVVRIPGGEDPCDLLVREGAGSVTPLFGRAVPWFDFLLAEVAATQGTERWREVDRVLGLIARVRRPIERDELVARLARGLDATLASVREALESLPERRRAALERERKELVAAAPEPARAGEVALVRRAFAGIAGAVLLDPSLAPGVGGYVERCPDGDLRRVLEAVIRLEERRGAGVEVQDVLVELGDDPARELVVELIDDASRAASARELCDGNLRRLDEIERQNALATARARARACGELSPEELHELYVRASSRPS